MDNNIILIKIFDSNVSDCSRILELVAEAVYTNGNRDASWKVILYDQWITDSDKSSDAYSYLKEARALPKTSPKKVTLIEITVYSNRSVHESMPQVKAACRKLDEIFNTPKEILISYESPEKCKL